MQTFELSDLLWNTELSTNDIRNYKIWTKSGIQMLSTEGCSVCLNQPLKICSLWF